MDIVKKFGSKVSTMWVKKSVGNANLQMSNASGLLNSILAVNYGIGVPRWRYSIRCNLIDRGKRRISCYMFASFAMLLQVA